MNVIKDFRNDLLERREVAIVVEHNGNPGLVHAAKLIAEHFKVHEDHVAVKQLKGKFGRDTFAIKANIYDKKEGRTMIEPKVKAKKEKK